MFQRVSAVFPAVQPPGIRPPNHDIGLIQVSVSISGVTHLSALHTRLH